MPSIQIANAQNICQEGARVIGSDNHQEYEAEQRVGGRLYLNTDNPAQCSGFIMQLEYCYYPPDDELQTFYHIYFGIYRREFNRQRNVQYQLLQQRIIPLSGFVNGFISGLDEEFSCTTLNNIIPAIRIQKGDIIGACLPRINSLDVVSDISNEEEDDSEEGLNANLHYIESDCEHIFAIPSTIDECDTRVQESRILHVYATRKILCTFL